MESFRPTNSQQTPNSQALWQVPNHFGPNQYMNTQPFTHKNLFPQHSNKIQTPQLQQPSTSKNTNFPVTKRLRSSDSQQTKMSIDELRFQDAHEYE